MQILQSQLVLISISINRYHLLYFRCRTNCILFTLIGWHNTTKDHWLEGISQLKISWNGHNKISSVLFLTVPTYLCSSSGICEQYPHTVYGNITSWFCSVFLKQKSWIVPRTVRSVCFVLNDGVEINAVVLSTIRHVYSIKDCLWWEFLASALTSDKRCTAGIRDNAFQLCTQMGYKPWTS